MPGPLGPFKHYKYLSDDAFIYTIRERGAVGDAVANVAEPVNTHTTIPRGDTLRHIYGSNTTAGVTVRKRAIICDPTNVLFATGGTFTVDGLVFTVEGKIGEKRRTI
jgi:hypothetical protein